MLTDIAWNKIIPFYLNNKYSKPIEMQNLYRLLAAFLRQDVELNIKGFKR